MGFVYICNSHSGIERIAVFAKWNRAACGIPMIDRYRAAIGGSSDAIGARYDAGIVGVEIGAAAMQKVVSFPGGNYEALPAALIVLIKVFCELSILLLDRWRDRWIELRIIEGFPLEPAARGSISCQHVGFDIWIAESPHCVAYFRALEQ